MPNNPLLKHFITGMFIFVSIVLTIVPSSAQNAKFGINTEPSNYFSTDALYVDVFKHAGVWKTPTHTSVATDADGYPLADCLSLWCLDGYPSGIYSFSMTGSGTIKFNNLAKIVTGSLQKTTSNGTTTTTCQVQMNSLTPGYGGFVGGPTDYAWLTITGVDPNDPPKNLHLMMPGYPVNTSQTFNKQFLQAIAPFCCLRMMDFMVTNNSKITTWASRPQPTAWGQVGGASYENMIALCNTANKDIWINIPYGASDDWAVGMADLLKNTLKPNLNIYLEYSNECWNWAGPFHAGWQFVEDQGLINSALPAADKGWARHGDQVAFELMHFTSIFQSELGARSNRLRPILAGMFVLPLYCSSGLSFIKTAYGAPNTLIYGIAGAPYFRPDKKNPASTVDDLFTQLNDGLNGQIVPELKQNIALANKYGVKYLAYECGPEFYPSDQAQFQLYQAALQDPRMGILIQNFASIWNSMGGDLCNFFDLCGAWTKWGLFGALTDVRQITNPPLKYVVEAGLANAYNSASNNNNGNGGGGGGNSGPGGGSGGGNSGPGGGNGQNNGGGHTGNSHSGNSGSAPSSGHSGSQSNTNSGQGARGGSIGHAGGSAPSNNGFNISACQSSNSSSARAGGTGGQGGLGGGDCPLGGPGFGTNTSGLHTSNRSWSRAPDKVSAKTKSKEKKTANLVSAKKMNSGKAVAKKHVAKSIRALKP